MSKNYAQNYSLAEVADLIADSILQERMLSREAIIRKILVFAKSFAGIKSDPNSAPTPYKKHLWLRTAEKKEIERKYWLGVAQKLCLDHELQQHYARLNNELAAQGFDVKWVKK